jgi:hypothetical protein
MLLRKATWREARLSLQRAHKDKRARKHLFRVAMMLLAPAACIFYLVWLIGSGALLFVPFVIPVFLWRMRREKQDAVPLRIAPGPPLLEKELSEDEQQRLRPYLARLALFYSVMVDRAGSESFLKEKVLPEGFEVTSRRIHLDLLKAQGLWETMAPADRDMMMMADGHWEWWQINQVTMGIEPVRLLRWILRIDFYLPVIGQQLRGDYAAAHELILAPEKVLNGKGLVDLATMRVARNAAIQYYARCIAEGISRGLLEPRNDEIGQWAKSVSEELKGKQHEDLVLGGKIVSEVTDEELQWALQLSERRFNFLKWAMGVMKDGREPDWEMSVFPAKTVETAAAAAE